MKAAGFKMGMVFQDFNLFPHKTALENIMLAPIKVLKKNKDECRQKAEELLNLVGLRGKGGNYPAQLSGGQQQRVAIARALALDPKIMLFDEPTSALDPEITGEVLSTIKTLTKRNMTMVIVTHEMSFARDISDRVLFMDDGLIVEQGPPEQIFGNPTGERLVGFLQNTNM